MAETLGSLCDKLIVVKLKDWHTEDVLQHVSLIRQRDRLQEEINIFITLAIQGDIPIDRLTFDAYKVYTGSVSLPIDVKGNIGNLIAQLAHANCQLWHEQEKVYDFKNVPVNEKDKVVEQIATLNLTRNQLIDLINSWFQGMIKRGK